MKSKICGDGANSAVSAMPLSKIPESLPKKLAISFWIWGLVDTSADDAYHDLEKRLVELKERGFNCIRIDSGAGLSFDANGRPRGAVEIHRTFPGHAESLSVGSAKGGLCDFLKRLVTLMELANKYDVHVILSSWMYLHTFWMIDQRIRREFFEELPIEERFMRMAREQDRILQALKEKGLHKRIAYVEALNESDVLPFMKTESLPEGSSEERSQCGKFRKLHEEAIEFLKDRHPDILFALDTCTAIPKLEILPRNVQVWSLHSYYSWWPVYREFEGNLLGGGTDLDNPAELAPVRRFLKERLSRLEDVKRSAGCDPEILEDWHRRIWLYSNVDPKRLPELDALLSESLEKNYGLCKQRIDERFAKAVESRNALFPGAPLVLGEGASYCCHLGLRWEERSDRYWELVDYAAGVVKQLGFWGCMPLTHSGPEDARWLSCPERLAHANKIFMAD